MLGQFGHGQVPDQVGGQLPPTAGHLLVDVAAVDDRRLAGGDGPAQGVGNDRAGRPACCPLATASRLRAVGHERQVAAGIERCHH